MSLFMVLKLINVFISVEDNNVREAPDVDEYNSRVMNFNVCPTKIGMNIEHSKKGNN